jgi:transcriptional regulator with XRE-family HTH domain
VSLYRLDAPELHRRLDNLRAARGLSWRAPGRELRLSATTFTRLANGAKPDADALVTLLTWLDTDIAYVIKPGEADPT